MSDCCGSGFLGGRLPSNTPSGGDGYVRSIIWVDLRIGPGGDGTESEPFNTVAAGISAVPDGGTLVVVGGDASAASPVALMARSLTVHGLSGQEASGGRAVVLPLFEYEIATGTQRLAFHGASLTLAHTGADNSLTHLFFENCPLVSVLADGDAPPITWVGSSGCSFSGSGGAATFDGGTVSGYVANSGAVTLDSVNVTGNVTSASAVTIRNGTTFGAGVTITAPSISIDPISYAAATDAGVTFSSTVIITANFLGATTGYVLTRQSDGSWMGEVPSGGGGGFSLPSGGKAGEVLESDGKGGAVWGVDDTGGLGSISTDVLIGRDTPSTGAAEEIGVGGGLEFTGSKSIQRSALAGDVTASAGSNTTVIANDAVTYAKLQNVAALSVVGRASNTSGDAADITAGTDGFVLQRSGATLAWGLIVAASITNSTITLAKFQDITSDRLLGRDTAGTGVVEQLTVSGGIEFTGSGGIQTSAFTGDVTKTAGGTATTIANDAVTYAKMQNVSATSRFLGRITASAGDVEELTGTQATTLLDNFTSSLKGLVPGSGGGTTNYLRADGTWTAPSFTVADNSITFAKIQDISTDVLIGRDTASTGDPEEIGVGGGLEFTGSKSIQRSALTGDVTASAGSGTTTIATAAVTFAKFQNVAGLSVVGRASNTSGVAADITAANDGEVLRRSGTTIGFGTITTAGITNSSVTFAKFQDISTDRLLGRDTAGTGAVEQITVGGGIEFTGSAGLQLSAFTGDVTKAAGGTALTIPNDTVTYAKMQNISATSRFLGRITIGAGDTEELTGTQATTLIDTFTTLLKGAVPASGGGTVNFLRADGTWTVPVVADDSITDAKLRDSVALSVIGRSANTTGSPADIAAANDGEVLRRSGTTLGFGTVATAGIGNSQVTLAKIANIATARILGRVTASSGVVEELTGTQATTLLDAFTSSLKGVAPASGGGTANFLRADGSWATPTGTTVPGGSTTQIQYNNAGAFDGASGIAVVGSETALGFGTTPATAGFLRFAISPGVFVGYVGHTGANAQALGAAGDSATFTDLFVGDGTTPGNASLYLRAKSQTVVVVGATNEFQFSSTTLACNANSITDASFIGLGTTVASSGLVRLVNNAGDVVTHIGHDGTSSVRVLGVGSNGSTFSDVYFGYNASAQGNSTAYIYAKASIVADLLTGGALSVVINSATEYSLNATTFDGNQNSLSDWSFIELGGTPATAGAVRLSSTNQVVGAGAGALAGTNVNLLEWTAGNAINHGNSSVTGQDVCVASGGNLTVTHGSTVEYTFSATALNFNQNYIDRITHVDFYDGTNAISSSGQIRVAKNPGVVVGYLSYDALNGRSALAVVSDGSTYNDVYVGDANTNGTRSVILGPKTDAIVHIGANDEYVFSATFADFKDNYLGFTPSGGALPTSGFVRMAVSGDQTLQAIRVSATSYAVSRYVSASTALVFGSDSLNTAIAGSSSVSVQMGGSGTTAFQVLGAGDAFLGGVNQTDASAKTMQIRAAGSTSSNNAGGTLLLMGGRRTGTGNYGAVRVQLNADDSTTYTMLEAAHLANARRVVSLCTTAGVTTTNMPTNTGDLVVFIGTSATAPSLGTAPVGGGILYFDSAGALKCVTPSGLIQTLAAA